MAATVRRRTLRWSMFWAVISYLITTLGTALTNYLTSLDVTPLQGSLISTGVGLVIVAIGVLIDQAKDGGNVATPPAPAPPYSPHHPYPAPPRPAARSRTSLVAAVVVVLLLCGGGGLALTYAAQWAAGRGVAFLKDQSTPPWEKKTQDPGTERIAGTASATEGKLTVSVSSVRVNEEVTMLEVTAVNAGDQVLVLPDFGSAQLDVPGASTLQPDPAASDWSQQVPSHGDISGRIVFDGVVAPEVTSVTLTFATIIGGFDGPRTIAVGIALG